MNNTFGRLKRWRLMFLAAGIMSLACSLSCRGVSSNHNTTAYKRLQVGHVLVCTVANTREAMVRNRTYAPCNGVAYAKWLSQVQTDKSPYVFPINESTGQFVDPWGNPIVLITEDDCLVALGSSGQNGIWEMGKNDDLVVTFKEVEVPTGPAGTTFSRQRITTRPVTTQTAGDGE